MDILFFIDFKGMITLEWGVYFIDAMQKLNGKVRGGVIGTYAVVTKI